MTLDFQNIKIKLLKDCEAFVHQKRTTLQSQIKSYQLGLTSETKSSAGDKHETGRAMLQLEIEKAGQQLASVKAMQEILERINICNKSDVICLGRLVVTDKANYYMAIGVGKITIDSQDYFAVSVNSPIGKQLLGKKEGAILPFNNVTILEIY